jgi:hypothetical protein
MIKGLTAAVGDQASDLRLLVAGAGFVHLPATGYRFVECGSCREIAGRDGFADLNWMQHRDSGQDRAAWCWVVAAVEVVN